MPQGESEEACNVCGGDFQMKMTRPAVVLLGIFLFSVPLIHGQDLSKYRDFSFGTTLADVSKQIGEKPADATVMYERPALIQELTWRPRQSYESPRPVEPVQNILFSFYTGTLYRMLVTYNTSAIEGLTDEDMIQVVSAKYGTATRPIADVDFPTEPSFRKTERVIARWEDSQYSFNLLRGYWTNTFEIVMFTKQLDAEAGISIAESVKLEQQELPQKEAARLTKAAEDLKQERQKNIQTLRP
jgi:hypothetical protein